MKTSVKHLLVLVSTIGLIASLNAGCQTTKGFGRDVEQVGKEIQGK